MEVQVLKREDLDSVITSLEQKVKESKPDLTGFAKLSDIEDAFKSWKPGKVEAKVDGEPVDAVLEDSAGGAVSGFAGMKLWKIPAGSIIVGTAGGVFVNELVEGFLAKQRTEIRGAVKLVAAGVVAGWGKRWLKGAAYPIAITLGVFGLSQILPIDKWVAGIADSLGRLAPGTIAVTGRGNGGGGRGGSTILSNFSTRGLSGG